MINHNKAILDAAGAFLGLQEWPGPKHNPRVVEMFDRVGHGWVEDDETPWCAAFVGSVLASLGLPHTGKLNARSYETYGQHVETAAARPGDIVVLWRGSRDSWQGHVAFFVRMEGKKLVLRGGNQGNAVTDEPYDTDRVVAVRRADGVASGTSRPVLRKGDSGVFVYDLQTMLVKHGYTLGKIDGVYGSMTLAALTQFQADRGLVPDGIAGDRSWAELGKPVAKSHRDVSMDDLKGKSRTISTAEKGKSIVKVGGAVGGAGLVVEQLRDATVIAREAEGILDQLTGIAPGALAIVLLGIVAWLAYGYFTRIEEIRLDDARTGANDRI